MTLGYVRIALIALLFARLPAAIFGQQAFPPPSLSHWDDLQSAGLLVVYHDLWARLKMPAILDLLFADFVSNYTLLSSRSARLELPSGESLRLTVSHMDHIFHYVQLRVTHISDHAILPGFKPEKLQLHVEARPYAGHHKVASLIRTAYVVRPRSGTSAQTLRHARTVLTAMLHSLQDAARTRLAPFPCRNDFRTYAGTCNNVAHSTWGAAFSPLRRTQAPARTDQQNSRLPNARVVSRALFSQTHPAPSVRRVSALAVYWGQFVDHDIALAPSRQGDDDASRFDIVIEEGDDPLFARHNGHISFHRSRAAPDARPCCGKGLAASTPGNPPNLHSSYVDASQVYGAERPRLAVLRTFNGGKLRTGVLARNGRHMPPINGGEDDIKIDVHGSDDDFIAGDERANEQPLLTSLHTIFLREHNRIAQKLGAKFACWRDEKIFQHARRIVSAQVQFITYRYFLPTILGSKHGLPAYRGYNDSVDATLDIFFSTVAFRFGHSMVPDVVNILKRRDTPHERSGIPLHQTFFEPHFIHDIGIEALLLGASHQKAESVDMKVVNSLQNELFRKLTKGVDLVAFNIQRGRDHAVHNYNDARELYRLRRHARFEDISNDLNVVQDLKKVYRSVDDIDAYVGAVAEPHIDDSELGPLLHAAVRDQFARLRDGDRFFYKGIQWPQELSDFEEVNELTSETLKLNDIFVRNSGGELTNDDFEDNVFRVVN